jgi:excisionase family DNA binding protein
MTTNSLHEFGPVPSGAAAYLPIKEACSLSRLSRTTLYKLIGENRLQKRKVGRKTYILKQDLDALFGGENGQ